MCSPVNWSQAFPKQIVLCHFTSLLLKGRLFSLVTGESLELFVSSLNATYLDAL